MPLKKQVQVLPKRVALKIRSKFTEYPRQSVSPTTLHSGSIEITFRHGSYSANSQLTDRTLSHKKIHGVLLLKRESFLWIYIYIYMKKCHAKNQNARYRLKFKYSRDDSYDFSKNMFDTLHHMYFYWLYFVKNSSRWSVTIWKNWKMLFIEINCLQSIREWWSLFKVPTCETSITEAIIYKSFGITYCFIHQFTNMEEMAPDRNARCSNVGIKKFKKLISLEKKYDWTQL